MLEELQIPSVDRIVFEQTPLSLVVCQVRFRPVLSISDPAQVASFQRALLERYPVLDPYGEVQLKLEGLPSQTHIEQGTPAHRWRFTDLDDTWTIVLAPDHLTIETRRYEQFEDFIGRLHELLIAFDKTFSQTIGTRIGLRYINEVRRHSPGMDWQRMIRPQLLGPLIEPALAVHIEQAIQQLILRFPDTDEGLSLRHGILMGTAIQPREGERPPESQFYLLDIDAYREYPRPGSFLLDPEIVGQHVTEYHEAIERVFRWAITEEYTASLGSR